MNKTYNIVYKTRAEQEDQTPMEVWLGLDCDGDLTVYYEDNEGSPRRWGWWDSSGDAWVTSDVPE